MRSTHRLYLCCLVRAFLPKLPQGKMSWTTLLVFTVYHLWKQLILEGFAGFTWHPCLRPGSVDVPEGDQLSLVMVSASMCVTAKCAHLHDDAVLDTTSRQALLSSITPARRGDSSGMVLVSLSSGHLPPSLAVSCVCLDGPNQPLCTPEPALLADAPVLKKLHEFWTACCQATQIYLATTCLQCKWTAQHALLPGSRGYRHLLLFHTFVGPVNLLCSSYPSARADCLALSFLSNHYLCPTTFSHGHRDNQRGKVCYLFWRHHTDCAGHTTPGTCVSFCPPVTHLLHCSPMCCRRKSTYRSMWVTWSCCLDYSVGQIRCLSSCQKQYSEQPRILSVQAT